MDGLRDFDTKQSKSDRERQKLYDFTHMWNLTENKDEQTKQKRIQKYKEEICGYQRRKGLGTGNKSITGQLYGNGW